MNQNTLSGSVRILVEPRAQLAQYVRDANKSSDGKTVYAGDHYLYSYRTIPSRGLLLLRPESLRSAEWQPFLRDLLFAALAGAALAAALSFLSPARSRARSAVSPTRRARSPPTERQEPLPRGGDERARARSRRVQPDGRSNWQTSREAERDFLLSVSHELKTPLTAIRGYAEGLAEGAFDAEEAARIIAIEAGRLERLVRDLLDLARMNRSEFSVRREPVDLAEVAREAVRRHEASAKQFGVALAAVGEETWVDGDDDRLLQVASNLVENALRETPAGGSVTVTAEPGRLSRRRHRPGHRRGRPAARVRALLPLRQGRQGPARRQRARPRDRASSSRRAMGGEVSVASGPGGTTFAVRLRPQLRGVHDLEVGTGAARLARAAGRSTTSGSARRETYQFDPLSATIIPYVFIACATIRACGGSFEMFTLAFSRTRRPIGGSDGSLSSSTRSGAPGR